MGGRWSGEGVERPLLRGEGVERRPARSPAARVVVEKAELRVSGFEEFNCHQT